MREFFRRYLFKNFGLKLFSLAFAAGLWMAVTRDPIAEVGIEVPIEFENMPPDMEISSEAVPQVQVRLRGAGHIVRELQPADVQAAIELGNLKPGERTFDLTSQQIHQPSGLEVVQLIPSQLHVSFDLRISRQVAVHPRIIGTFASGYELGQIVVEPPVVTVIGPRERLEAVDAAMTDPIDVSGAIDRIKFSRHAYVSDPLIQVARPQPVRITVIMRKVSPSTGTEQAPQ